jgi:hypothetical protein
MSDLPIVIALVLVVVVPVVLVRAHAAISEPLLTDWARAHGLRLTADNRSLVARYLRRARVLRSWGAIAGLLLPTPLEFAVSGRFAMLGFASDGSAAPFQGPMTIFIGYLVGALCAELSVARRVDPADRSASLIPRGVEDYLPRRLVHAQRALGLAVVLGVLAIGMVPYEHPAAQPTWLGLLTGVAMFAGFAVALEALERWLVRRPQPFADSALVAADDAIRAQSLHALAASGLALLLISLSGVAIGLAASDVTVLRWTMWPLATIAFVLSIRACQDIAHRPWRVRRSMSHSTRPART